MLQAAGQLAAFPSRPRVLDDWEYANLFDSEYAEYAPQLTKKRRREVLRDREALWSTGQTIPPGLPAPAPPIDDRERSAFDSYYNSRSSLYSYLLPSDITRRCLEYFRFLPADFPLPIDVNHLLVDEYQDLNPVDIELIDEIHSRGPALFVAGDDDQSIYLFRYAFPRGIQEFETSHGGSVTHTLRHCFRCPEEVLEPALGPLLANAPDSRIPKDYIAMPTRANPPVVGSLHCWSMGSPAAEAQAIAESCHDLIEAGIQPDGIAVLLSNRRVLEKPIAEAMSAIGVPFRVADSPPYSGSAWGRLAYALLRCICDEHDLVARRTVMGMRRGVGNRTLSEISSLLVGNAMRLADAFDRGLPGSPSARATTAVAETSRALRELEHLSADSTLVEFGPLLANAVRDWLGPAEQQAWTNFSVGEPDDVRADEMRDLLASGTSREALEVLAGIQVRLGIENDAVSVQGVRIMSVHGSKGLTFDVVFIPGLEQGLLPAEQVFGYPGLLQESARLLFVGMTRARLSVALSLAQVRTVNGRWERRSPSQFAGHLGRRFESRSSGLTSAELAQIMSSRDALLA
jgi:ATP-dependent DNA helicase UvrD/PcrA